MPLTHSKPTSHTVNTTITWHQPKKHTHMHTPTQSVSQRMLVCLSCLRHSRTRTIGLLHAVFMWKYFPYFFSLSWRHSKKPYTNNNLNWMRELDCIWLNGIHTMSLTFTGHLRSHKVWTITMFPLAAEGENKIIIWTPKMPCLPWSYIWH